MSLSTLQLQGLKLLLVEDDPNLRFLMADFLEWQGAHVATAMVQSESLKTLEKVEFDAILTNLTLPEGDGYSLIERWRQREATRQLQRLAAIVMVNSAWDIDSTRAARADIHHLFKPVNPFFLVRTIRRLVVEAR